MLNALNRIGWVMLLGTALAITPALSTHGSFLSYEQAKAEKGGNGGGNKGGNGGGNSGGNNGGGNSNKSDGGGKSNAKSDNGGGKSNKSNSDSTSTKSSSSKANSAKAASAKVASTEEETVDERKNAKGKTASKLGALNAAHASATAFANASIDSRIGKIRAYYEASQAAAGLQDEAATLTQEASDLRNGLNADVLTAYENLLNAPEGTDTTALQQAYDDAVAAATAADSTFTKEQFEADYTAWSTKDAEAKAKADEAATAESDLQGLLDAAANKPVDQEVLDALDKLMEGKLPPPDTTVTTPDTTTETTPDTTTETPTETTADTSGGDVTGDLPIIN